MSGKTKAELEQELAQLRDDYSQILSLVMTEGEKEDGMDLPIQMVILRVLGWFRDHTEIDHLRTQLKNLRIENAQNEGRVGGLTWAVSEMAKTRK